MLGVGVMLHLLVGSSQDPAKYYGRTIRKAEITDNRLRLTFTGGAAIDIWDNGQSCCESRYMTTDDDLASLRGRKLRRIEAKNGPTENADDEPHETCFVEVATDRGFITLVNHNEHNGYYGGFGLTITEVD